MKLVWDEDDKALREQLSKPVSPAPAPKPKPPATVHPKPTQPKPVQPTPVQLKPDQLQTLITGLVAALEPHVKVPMDPIVAKDIASTNDKLLTDMNNLLQSRFPPPPQRTWWTWLKGATVFVAIIVIGVSLAVTTTMLLRSAWTTWEQRNQTQAAQPEPTPPLPLKEQNPPKVEQSEHEARLKKMDQNSNKIDELLKKQKGPK